MLVSQVLVCPEGSARGVDFKNVDVVMNAACPSSYREYVHRAGRTARFGSSGIVITQVDEGRGEDHAGDADVLRRICERLRLSSDLKTVTPGQLHTLAALMPARRRDGGGDASPPVATAASSEDEL